MPFSTRRPRDQEQAAAWVVAWHGREDDPRAPWALARLELLRDPPNGQAAAQLLEEAEPPAEERCSFDADRVLALWADGRRGEALGRQGCATDTPEGREGVARLLHEIHLRAAAAAALPEASAWPSDGPRRDDAGELVDAVDHRTLFRRGPELVLAVVDAAESAERQAALDELDRLTRAHVERFALDEAMLDWWRPLVELQPDAAAIVALRRLVEIARGPPATKADAGARAVALAEVARDAAGAGRGLIAVRALHLRAFGLDVADAEEVASAWRDVFDASQQWPTVRALALERLAWRSLRDGDVRQADLLISTALEICAAHAVDQIQVALLRDRWKARRRPALAGAEVEDLVGLLAGRSADLSGQEVLALQEELGVAAWRAGWAPLARAVCSENQVLAEGWNQRCRADACLSVLAFTEEDPRARLRVLDQAIERAAACNHPSVELSALGSAAFFRLLAGDHEESGAALARAEALIDDAGPLWAAYLAAVRLADREIDESALDAFDLAIGALDFPDGNLDYRGWLSDGYEHWLANRLDAPVPDLLRLVARREGVRWLGGNHGTIPDGGPDLLSFQALPMDRIALLASWAEAPALLDVHRPPEGVFDGAALEGARWVLDGAPVQSRGALLLLAGLAEKAGASSRAGPLLGLGTGSEVSVPIALLPAEGGVVGDERPTGLWVPTLPAEPATWRSGRILAALGRPGALGLVGVDDLVRGVPPGWSNSAISSPAQVGQGADSVDVLQLSAHGEASSGGGAVLVLGPGPDDRFGAADLRSLRLVPGSLVVLAVCETGGGTHGRIPMDLPMAAFQAGAGAVIFSRFPVSSRSLHEALGRLYAEMPFRCTELVERWHRIRSRYAMNLLGVEVAVSTACLPGST